MTPKKSMKAVVFAGGIGTRMWPLSRKNSPKQFEPIIEGKSTLQLAVDRLRPEFDWNDIYISTGEQYRTIIQRQLPHLPHHNVIGEPEMRDVAPAVGYVLSIIAKSDPDTPVAILWSDHLMQQVDKFKQALQVGAKLLEANHERYIFIGQKPRFANQNLGWIEFGNTLETIDQIEVKEYVSWHYRPNPQDAQKFYDSGRYAWNPGYFVVTPKFVLSQFKIHVPAMYEQLMTIQQAYGTINQERVLASVYPKMEKISFDDAVVTKSKPDQAVVLSVDLGWSDVGTWEALKEALQKNPQDNLLHGNVSSLDTQNSVLYSYTDQKLAVIDVNDLTVVVTPDVVLVTPHRSIPKIKILLKTFEGNDNERYT